ncbi:Serine acetyltransferase, N-terminal [Dillenia turbinata]|uniref:serine O-acetyltransferase n=1 Tax=Dillenia turbinata TaxID=194707 RepID=A0AAN8ZFN7_9MAGN
MVAWVGSSRNKRSRSRFSLDPIQNQCRLPGFCKPNLSSIVFCNHCLIKARDGNEADDDILWLKIKEEAQFDLEQEPILSRYYFSLILSQASLESALANHLATKLGNMNISNQALFEVFYGILAEDFEIRTAIRDDLKAIKEKDPACISYVHCFLNFKGFLACQSHRIAHKLWSQNRTTLALLIQSRVSEVFAVDIHPGAKIGKGIVFDHATGIVIGETTVIGNYVTILHNVTLGGTGKFSGDRHPKIGDGVFIGAGSSILGNIRIGDGAKIGAASVVLKEVPANATAVGNPARLVGGKRIVFGEKFEDHKRFRAVMKKATSLAGGFHIGDFFPSLGFVGVISGMTAELEKVFLETDSIAGKIIQQRIERNAANKSKQEDLVDVLLHLKDDGGLKLPLTIDNIKSIILIEVDSP